MFLEKVISLIIISCVFYRETFGCYSLPFEEWHYMHIGCFKDEWPPKIIPMIEGNQNVSHILTNHFKKRKDPVNKCYLAAKHLGYKYFGVQDNGLCVTSEDAQSKYSKHGTGTDCIEGKGGPMSNDIYMITSKPGIHQRNMVCNFVNITGIAMIKGSGMPGGSDIELGHNKFIGIQWRECESFCKANEEFNSFAYFPNMPEINGGNPTYTCFLKSSIVKERIDFNMAHSRCFTTTKM